MDLAGGADLTMPDGGDRYVSLMVVNQDHYINRVFHSAGEHRLTMDDFDTRYALLAMRVFVDPNDPGDVVAANDIQDGLAVSAASAEPLVLVEYDQESPLTRSSTSSDRGRLGRPAGGGGVLRQCRAASGARRVPHRRPRRSGRRLLVDLALQQ